MNNCIMCDSSKYDRQRSPDGKTTCLECNYSAPNSIWDLSPNLNTASLEAAPAPTLRLLEVEVHNLKVSPGDTLAMVIRSDELDATLIDHLKKSLKSQFPDNKVLIFGLDQRDNIQFSVITQEKEKEENKKLSSCATANYCVDCNCGKKEAQES